jgi:hypothetical protein
MSILYAVLSCACRQLSVYLSTYTAVYISRNSISVLCTLLLLLLLLFYYFFIAYLLRIYSFGLTQYLP